MIRLLATMLNELRLLARDRAGLLVLFLMPSVLVVVVSLVQENVLQTTGEAGIRAAFIDEDGDTLGKALRVRLEAADSLELIQKIDSRAVTAADIDPLLAGGDIPFVIRVPAGATEGMRKRAEFLIRQALPAAPEKPGAIASTIVSPLTVVDPENETPLRAAEEQATQSSKPMEPEEQATESSKPMEQTAPPEPPEIAVYFDPLVQGAFRTAVVSAVNAMLMAAEMEIKARILSAMVSEQVSGLLRAMAPPAAPPPDFSMAAEWGAPRLITVDERRGLSAGHLRLPTSVQHNVPAWALFGMFFIVVPLGGALIREKQDGTLARLLVMPVPYVALLAGRLMAYVLVCLAQFGIILLMGRYVLPLLGAPVLELSGSPLAMVAVVISAGLAAAGYGMLLGTISTTYEQASMFGAVSVVIAAAIGGIMVPVYVMPDSMRVLSHFSPLAWGLTALTDIFARQADLFDVLDRIGRLLAFAAGCQIVAWGAFRRKRN